MAYGFGALNKNFNTKNNFSVANALKQDNILSTGRVINVILDGDDANAIGDIEFIDYKSTPGDVSTTSTSARQQASTVSQRIRLALSPTSAKSARSPSCPWALLAVWARSLRWAATTASTYPSQTPDASWTHGAGLTPGPWPTGKT